MGIYLSPVWHTILPQYRSEFGYIEGKQTMNGDASLASAIYAGNRYLLDCGMYTGKFNVEAWASKFMVFKPYASACIGVVVPDVLHRHADGMVTGDWRATVTQYEEYAPIVRQHGYPTAFVSQDGLPVDATPWEDFDVLFVGGSDHHKLTESWPLIAEAKRRGKWVHIGRVNSAKRIALFWMADSWDGTTLAIEPSIRNQQRMLFAARRATTKANGTQRSLLDGLYHSLPYSHCVG